MSLLNRLGANCSLIIFSHVSKFCIVLSVVLIRSDTFS